MTKSKVCNYSFTYIRDIYSYLCSSSSAIYSQSLSEMVSLPTTQLP